MLERHCSGGSRSGSTNGNNGSISSISSSINVGSSGISSR